MVTDGKRSFSLEMSGFFSLVSITSLINKDSLFIRYHLSILDNVNTLEFLKQSIVFSDTPVYPQNSKVLIYDF